MLERVFGEVRVFLGCGGGGSFGRYGRIGCIRVKRRKGEKVYAGLSLCWRECAEARVCSGCGVEAWQGVACLGCGRGSSGVGSGVDHSASLDNVGDDVICAAQLVHEMLPPRSVQNQHIRHFPGLE